MDEQAQHGGASGSGSPSPSQPTRFGNKNGNDETFRNEQGNGSETIDLSRNHSENYDDVSSNNDKVFPSQPSNISERDRNDFGHVGNSEETISEAIETFTQDARNETDHPAHRKREGRHDVAIKHTAAVYRYFGVNVTDRSVNNWVLRPERNGKLRLADSGYDEEDGMWYIATQCIVDDLGKRRGVSREDVLEAIEDARAGRLEPKAIPVMHESAAEGEVETASQPEETPRNATENKDEMRSKEENSTIYNDDRKWEEGKTILELRTQLRVQQELNEQLRKDRDRDITKIADEFRKDRDTLIKMNDEKAALIAEKDQQLKQLSAPQPNVVRDADYHYGHDRSVPDMTGSPARE